MRKKIKNQREYIGLDADKFILAEEGTKYIATDTKKVYVYGANGTIIELSEPAPTEPPEGYGYNAGILTLGKNTDSYQAFFDFNAEGVIDFRGVGTSLQVSSLEIFNDASSFRARINMDNVNATDTENVLPSVAGVLKVSGFILNAQTGTSYTLTYNDVVNGVTFNNASPIAFSIPTHATSGDIQINSEVSLINLGAGVVTIGGAGVTILQNVGGLTIAQNEVRKISNDVWVVSY